VEQSRPCYICITVHGNVIRLDKPQPLYTFYRRRDGAEHEGGCAITDEGTWKNATSRPLRRTSPLIGFPPALRHFGISCKTTRLGCSPAFKRRTRPDERTFPHPTLNAQLTKAPYWFSFSVTESLMADETHSSAVRMSERRRLVA
jgi:hypothetical protein